MIFTDPRKAASDIQQDEKARAYVPYNSIPDEEIRALENLALSSKRKMTKDKAERAYAAAVLGDKELLRKIVAE